MKKKTSIEWLSEKISGSKGKNSETSITERSVSQSSKSRADTSTTPTTTTTSTRTSIEIDLPNVRKSGVGDVGEWNTFIKSQGIIKEEIKTEYLYLEEFEYRVFRSHFETLKRSPESDGVEVEALASDMTAHAMFKDKSEAIEFCKNLDEVSGPSSGQILLQYVTLLDADIVVKDDRSQVLQQRQLKLRKYIRSINEREIQGLLNSVLAETAHAESMSPDAGPPRSEGAPPPSSDHKPISMFTIANVKRLFRRRRIKTHMEKAKMTKRQRRISVVRDEILKGIVEGAKEENDSDQENDFDDYDAPYVGRQDSFFSRLKFAPVKYAGPSTDRRRRSSVLTAEQLKVIESYIDQNLGYASDDDEDE